MTGRAGEVILESEGTGSDGRLSIGQRYVPEGTLTVRIPAWRSFFSALAEGEDAHEKRGSLEDQTGDLIKAHMPTPFRKRREKSCALLYLSE